MAGRSHAWPTVREAYDMPQPMISISNLPVVVHPAWRDLQDEHPRRANVNRVRDV